MVAILKNYFSQQIFCCIVALSCCTYSFAQVGNDDVKPDSSGLVHSMLLVGNAYDLWQHDDVKDLLESHINNSGKKSSVVFLGNNAGKKGFSDSEDNYGKEAEKSLKAGLKLLKDYTGDIVFIPGNRDWAKGKPEGVDYVKEQRKYIEKYLDKKHVFLPPKGQPGPEEIKISKDIVLIVIDSQWWLHDFKKKLGDLEDGVDFYIQLKDALNRNRNKKVIFAAHHPIFSNGIHGGKFPFKYNLFPLTQLNKNLYIPLPGFLYTGYRKFLGGKQDMAHPTYKEFRESLLGLLKEYPNITYVAAHDHSLQYILSDSIHQIISGSAGSISYTSKSKKAKFVTSQQGFSKLNFYDNGDVFLEFWVINKANEQSSASSKGILAYQTKLYNKPLYHKKKYKKLLKSIDYTDSLVTALPKGVKNRTGKLQRYLMGENYREEWMQPVTAPVFDISTFKGGLKILKRGGGKQTKSLRMEDDKGQQWVLRSIEKDPTTGIPDAFNMGLASELVQDAISSSIPYSALSVPIIADAVGIYHTNPKLFYVVNDPRLGKYQKDLANGFYIFEERPAGNRKDIESFGNSKDIVNSLEMIEKTMDDTKNYVDQHSFLKSRIIDVFLNDWDRHEDQWRWAKFKEGKKVKYRPVPRDRDQTFYVTEGLIYRIASQRWAYWKNQGLDYDVMDMAGLTFNARYLDRRFLNELTLDDWLSTAKIMQSQLTDSVIREAVYKMPENVAKISGEEIITKLKSKRDKLPELAKKHYLIIAKKVDVVGSDEDERFEVERLPGGDTKVTVYELSKKGKKKDIYYSRTFKYNETKEIRLYGLKGKDEFRIKGKVDKGRKIRVIGGKNKDKIKDKSEVKGLSKKTLVYDRKKNDLDLGKESRNLTSKKKFYNTYDYYSFKYDKVTPLISYLSDDEDGMFLGGGMIIKTHGFKKEPYATKQKITGKVTFARNAFKLNYEGDFTSVIGSLDLNLFAEYYSPSYSQNFFGFGNNTELPDDNNDNEDFNRVRGGIVNINPMLKTQLGKNISFSFGGSYQNRTAENSPDRFISQLNINGLDPSIFNQQELLGINSNFTIDTRNHEAFPTLGLFWKSDFQYHYGLTNSSAEFVKLSTELDVYLSRKKNYRTVLALRVGGAVNIGDYEYYHANYIGGEDNLRGYLKNRFGGDKCLYQNTELRFRLFNFSNFISNGEVGLTGFYDIGRVWYKNESSSTWHDGYGVGLWISFFDSFVINVQQEFSKEDNLLSFGIGFLY